MHLARSRGDVLVGNKYSRISRLCRIAETIAAQTTRHTGNTIRDYGCAAKGLVYPSGMATTGGSILSNNVIVSNGKAIRFGVNQNGFPPPDVVPDEVRDIAVTSTSIPT